MPALTRRVLGGLLAGAAALAPSSLGRASEILRVGDQKGGARALLEAANLLEGLPFAVEWSEFPAAAPLLEALNAGAIDTGLVGDAPMIFAQAAGVPLKAVGAWRSDPVGTAIIVNRDSVIGAPADLKGRRLGTGKGSIGHYLALVTLDAAGLSTAEVELRFLLPADAKAALAAGSIDAWSSWDPYTSLARLREGARVIADGRGVTSGLGFQVASDTAIARKRPMLDRYLERLAEARVWSLDHVASYAGTLARLMAIPSDVAAEWFGRARTQFVVIDEQVVVDQQRTIDNYHRFGVIQRRVLAADALDASFNGAIARFAAKG